MAEVARKTGSLTPGEKQTWRWRELNPRPETDPNARLRVCPIYLVLVREDSKSAAILFGRSENSF